MWAKKVHSLYLLSPAFDPIAVARIFASFEPLCQHSDKKLHYTLNRHKTSALDDYLPLNPGSHYGGRFSISCTRLKSPSVSVPAMPERPHSRA